MARLYFLSGTNSDLTGGADFSRYLYPNNNSATTTLSISVAQATTASPEISYGFTSPIDPSIYGTTGNYTVVLDITTTNTNIQASVQLHRVNSAGTIQTSSAISATQTFGASPTTYTFSFTNLSLGTWASGDRLRVDYRFGNAALHSASSFSIAINDPDCYVLTPFNVRSFVTT